MTKLQQEKPKWESRISTISLALIPFVIAAVGWWIQKSVQDESIQRDYVQLAVSILKNADTAKANSGLREWAVELLNANSTVKFNAAVQEQLKTGNISLSNSVDSLSEDPRTKLSLATIQPAVRYLCIKLIQLAKIQGIEIIVNQGYRSQKGQDSLYAIGRTKPGKIITYEKTNIHTKGLAFDFFMKKKGREIADKQSFKIVSTIGENLGLIWGGDLNDDKKNNYHFELKQSVGN